LPSQDPAPGFVALRNCVDYERFLREHRHQRGVSNLWKRLGEGRERLIIDEEADKFFAPLSDKQLGRVADAMRITTKQVQLIYEIDRLSQMEEFIEKLSRTSSTSKDDKKQQQIEDLEKRYRLMVKKRLNKSYREELSACRTKKEMQDCLSDLFDESLNHYRSVAASVRKLELRVKDV